MRKILYIIAIYLALCLFNTVPFSYAQKGEEIFQTKCGACHGTVGEAPSFSPVKYASNQWKRFFERNKHARKKDISNEISTSDMLIIKDYLITHAADSDLPIAAGLRHITPEKPTVILKMASNAPEGMELTRFIKNDITIGGIERVTDGEVTFSWYHGGVMGDDEDWIAKMNIDQLQGAALDSSGVDKAFPEMGIMQLPFIFNDFDEIANIKQRLRGKFIKLIEDKGYKILIFGDQPFDDIYSTKREIRTPEDFAKVKFAAYYGVVAQETLNALGAGQIPISVPEIVSSMRARIFDTLICPAIWYVGSQLYTITRYVIPSNMRCTMAAIVLTKKTWDRIPEEHHQAIVEVMRELEPGLNGILANNNERCYKAMINYGMKEVKLTPDEVEVLKKKTRSVWDKLAGKVYPREILDTVLGYLEEYRSD